MSDWNEQQLNEQRLNDLVDLWRDNALSDSQTEELNQTLRASSEARRVFSQESQLHGLLHCAAGQAAVERSADLANTAFTEDARKLRAKPPRGKTWLPWSIAVTASAVAAIAAGLLVAMTGQWWSSPPKKDTVATLASSENAAWESELPTTPGSKLTPGRLSLRNGVATIRFHSGAELLVEAPAELELVSAMRGKLHSGAAVMNVPETAHGFVLDTPEGYAVDFGTRFAISVNRSSGVSDFELLEGEIEVHHRSSRESLKVNQEGERVQVSKRSVVVVDENTESAPIPSQSTLPNVLRVGTNGRCGSTLVRWEKRHRYLHPEVLSVKQTKSGKWNHRSYFEFDFSEVDLSKVNSARLRLNLVPSTQGNASRLPKENRFGVYGMTDQTKAGWQLESDWKNAPAASDGELLGNFVVQRSQERGVFGIENQSLLDFLRAHKKQHGDRPATMILVRETTQIKGTGGGMVHHFASDRHPESVGPLLEFQVKTSEAK